MTRTDIYNGSSAIATLALAAVVLAPVPRGTAPSPLRSRSSASAEVSVAMVNGHRSIVDANGTPMRLGNYRRIVAGSTVARELLIELVAPARLAAIVDYDLDKRHDSFRYEGIARIASADDVESMLSLAPDLIVVHSMNRPDRMARMREAGLRVFDLGTMRGVDDLYRSLAYLGHLVGEPTRAARLADTFRRRFAVVAADVSSHQRKSAIYASAIGDRIFGGTLGSSFHDVLGAAGLVDAAAGAFTGWPQYGAEDLLTLNPEIVVTPQGMGQHLCRLPGAGVLRACADNRAGVVEVPGYLLNTPGLGMLDAAERIHEQVYGARGP